MELADEAVARGAMQKASEFCALADLLSERELQCIVEIGTARGGSLYAWCQLAAPDALIVSIDLPGGPFGGGYSADEAEAFAQFTKPGQRLVCVREDSHAEPTRQRLEEILEGRKIDFLFIDGDHTYYGARQDFLLYAPLLAEDGVVALHDIVVHTDVPECRVDALWQEVKGRFEHIVFLDPEDDRGWGSWGGIGVAFGAHTADRSSFPPSPEGVRSLEQDVARARAVSQEGEDTGSEETVSEEVERYRQEVEELDELLWAAKAQIRELETFREELFASPTWRVLRAVNDLRLRFARFDRVSGLMERMLKSGISRQAQRQEGEVPRAARVKAREDSGVPQPDAIRFETGANPRASIVIPTYKNVHLTLRCLAAVARSTRPKAYEMIVVDDASEDGSVETLNRVPGLRLISNTQNEGFLESCNRGAAGASGDYIVLLNNDTEVTAGWLDALLAAADSDSKVGAVGSKLVYPDGSLQEAGAFVWRDGRAWNFGRGRNPAEPEFNFRRDVDYCSAASLLVRRDVWQELGGFDSRYRPAFYEDTDLCFAIAAKGLRVLYEPTSVVVHHEGSSHGTDDERDGVVFADGKRFQDRNRHIFAEKWAGRLATHLPPGTGQGYRGGRIDPRLRVLVIDTWVPAHDRDAGSLRMSWMLRLLASMTGWTSLLAWDGNLREPYVSDLQSSGVEVLPKSPGLAGLKKRGHDFYDVVLISRPHVAADFLAPVRSTFPKAAIIYDTVDLHHLRYSRKRDSVGLGSLDAARGIDVDELRRAETECFRRSDIVAAVTEVEADVIRQLAPATPTVTLPTVHPIPRKRQPSYRDRADVVFIGSYQHDPNVDAAAYFSRQIFPLVAARTDARLFLLGADPPEEVRDLQSPQIVVPGYLPSVDAYFSHCKVFVAPVRYGAGMKGKIGHALAFGIPVVTTTIGAEGMDLVDGETALIRDDPREFSEAVIAVYQDEELWARLSQHGRRIVRERWTPEVMKMRLEELLERLESTKAARVKQAVGVRSEEATSLPTR
jgi:O-antigen biosynthesis protein